MDTYQISAYRGYVIVNLCFFRPDLEKDDVTVKVTPMPAGATLMDSTPRSREIQTVIQEVILEKGGTLVNQAGQ